MVNFEGGPSPEEYLAAYNIDRVNTTGTVWLGLTVGCAQCHDHKYDPISQKEHYQLEAFFDNLQEVDIDAPLAGELGPYLKEVGAYSQKRRDLLEKYHIPELQRPFELMLIEAADHPGKWLDWDNTFTELLSGEGMPVFNQGERILRLDP